MPSTPSFPRERQSAQRPAARREIESFDSAESGFLTLAANALFQEVITFGGRADSVIIDASAAGLNVRFRNRGEAPRAAIRLQGAGERRFALTAEIVEVQDPTGAGGQLVTATGRFASRAIDVRSNNPGPSRERPTLPRDELATQVLTGE